MVIVGRLVARLLRSSLSKQGSPHTELGVSLIKVSVKTCYRLDFRCNVVIGQPMSLIPPHDAILHLAFCTAFLPVTSTLLQLAMAKKPALYGIS